MCILPSAPFFLSQLQTQRIPFNSSLGSRPLQVLLPLQKCILSSFLLCSFSSQLRHALLQEAFPDHLPGLDNWSHNLQQSI